MEIYKSKNLTCKALAFLVTLIMLISVFVQFTSASVVESPCTLYIEYKDENQPLSNVRFHIYRVADITEHAEYRLTSEFSSSKVDLEPRMTNSRWVEAAEQLEAYAESYGLNPYAKGETDQNGYLSLEGLEKGVYVVKGDDFVSSDHATYKTQVFCVVLPERDNLGLADYSVTVAPKFERIPASGRGKAISTPKPVVRTTTTLKTHDTGKIAKNMPKTGDENRPELWIALILLAVSALAFGTYAKSNSSKTS